MQKYVNTLSRKSVKIDNNIDKIISGMLKKANRIV